MLDVTAVNPSYEDLKEVALFLAAPGALDPQFGIGLYVSVGGSDWSYRGYVGSAHPSEVMPLQVRVHCAIPYRFEMNTRARLQWLRYRAETASA